MKKVIKISIFGPKPYAINAYDSQSVHMVGINEAIKNLLDGFYREDKIVLGLTGLSLGLEQSFVEHCKSFDYEYVVYTAHDNPEKSWKDLPKSIVDKYDSLLDEAKNIISVGNGAYSPKKCLQRQLRILSDSDYVIYVSGFLPIKNPKIQSLVESKSLIVIPV